MDLIKRISSIAFGLAFLMGIILFTGYGRTIIPYKIAQHLFIAFGAIGLLLNLISFQQGKHAPLYNFVFWISSIILFIGFVFRMLHWPFGTYILIFGMVMLGLTFVIPSTRDENQNKGEDLLDQ